MSPMIETTLMQIREGKAHPARVASQWRFRAWAATLTAILGTLLLLGILALSITTPPPSGLVTVALVIYLMFSTIHAIGNAIDFRDGLRALRRL